MKSDLVEKILNRISPKEHEELFNKIEQDIAYLEQLKNAGRIFNTDTSISIDIIREHGFNPIGITCMMCEETFIFDTFEEADNAYNILEKGNGGVSGWWYSLNDFNIALDSYKDEFKILPKVYWLNNKYK